MNVIIEEITLFSIFDLWHDFMDDRMGNIYQVGDGVLTIFFFVAVFNIVVFSGLLDISSGGIVILIFEVECCVHFMF